MKAYVPHKMEWRQKLLSVKSALAELQNDITLLGRTKENSDN